MIRSWYSGAGITLSAGNAPFGGNVQEQIVPGSPTSSAHEQFPGTVPVAGELATPTFRGRASCA